MEISSEIKKIIINLFGKILNSKKSKCIFYHDLHSDRRFSDMSTTIDMFEQHIDIIRDSNFKIVNEVTKEQGEIEICFDDGLQGIYRNIEVINRLEVPITLFIITSLIGEDIFLSKEQIQELSINPFVKIGSHTHTHTDLSLLSDRELELELEESKRILPEICRTEIKSICLPKGLFNKKVIHIANKLSYKKQYCSIPGSYYDEDFQSVKKRSLVQFYHEKEFKNILHGGDHILSLWYKLKHFRK